MVTIFANRNGKNATVSKSVLFTLTPINIYTDLSLCVRCTKLQYSKLLRDDEKEKNCESEMCVQKPRTRQSSVRLPEERERPASFSRVIANACTHYLRVLSENDIYRARVGREERPSPSVPAACTVTLSLSIQSSSRVYFRTNPSVKIKSTQYRNQTRPKDFKIYT